MVKQNLPNYLFRMVGPKMCRQFLSEMRESKIQNFSIFYLGIFKGNKNYESTACHQQTPLESMYSVTSET
jgi:hypothetical protein